MDTATPPRQDMKDSLLLLFVIGLLAAQEKDFTQVHRFAGRLGLDDCRRMRERLARIDNTLKAREEMIR